MRIFIFAPANDMQIRWAMKFLWVNVMKKRCEKICSFSLSFFDLYLLEVVCYKILCVFFGIIARIGW